MFNLIHMSMLARVRKEGWFYKVEAFVTTELGPQWVTIEETKYESLAMELREYIRYHATTQWVTRYARNYKATRKHTENTPY